MKFFDLAVWQQAIVLVGALALVVYIRTLPYIHEKKKGQKSEKKNAGKQ